MTCKVADSKYKRFYYVCYTNKYMHKKCKLPLFQSKRVDREVFAWIEKLLQDPEAVLVGLKRTQELHQAANAEAASYLANVEQLIARQEEELDYLIQEAKEFKDNPRVREQYRQQINQCAQTLERLEQERTASLEQATKGVLSDKEIAERVSEIEKLGGVLAQLGTLDFANGKLRVEVAIHRIQAGLVAHNHDPSRVIRTGIHHMAGCHSTHLCAGCIGVDRNQSSAVCQ